MDSQRIDRTKWKRYLYPLSIEAGKPKVKAISFNLKANHQSGSINVTDLQLQVGKQVTVQVPHTSEFLDELRYGFDEATNINDPALVNPKKKGVQPIKYTNLKNRAYNIVGRGHEVVSLPNVFHEDYKIELLTSGLDLELYAKDDFDLLRISTNGGAMVPGRVYTHPALSETHPLNMKYTREFYFNGGKAGDKITLSAELEKASLGSTNYAIGGKFQTSGLSQFTRQRLMVAPFGSFRLRIEFYKRVVETLTDPETGEKTDLSVYKDVGIGYYGTATFNQIKAAHTF